MKRFFRECAWVGGSIFVALLQTSILPVILWPEVSGKIQLALLVPICLVLLMRPGRAAEVALLVAYMFDLQSTFPFGFFLGTISISLVTFLFFQSFVFKQRHAFVYLLNTTIATIVFQLLFALTIILLQRLRIGTLEPFLWSTYVRTAFLQLLVHGSIILVGMFLIERAMRKLSIPAQR